MESDFLVKVAEVLEAIADGEEVQAAVKTAAVKEARDTRVRELAERYNQATGEDLDEATLSKLASDEGMFEAVKRMVEKTAGSAAVESMGGPGEVPASRPAPRNKKEAAEASAEKFAQWIINS
jgi:hypothetical protein